MKVSCPVCSQRIALDAENLAELRGATAFNCPSCGASIPLSQSSAAAPTPSAADVAAAEIEEIARSFDSRYQIKRLLGRGGMGAVYEGFDTRLDRRVAVKILPQGTGGHHDALVRFEREAKAMAALDHPNIVHIHDYGQTPDGNPYFVMEFIDGMDVHKLRRSGQLDIPGALDLVSQVCAALHYAHSRGIVHRDIKPGNILVTREGVAKVADFGLAKVLGTEDLPKHDITLTLSGTALGTPDYMAPEQIEGGHVDHRADIYSLGVMLYDLLTGSPPRGAWPPPSQRVQIDVRLDEIVLRALQHNPSSRYQAAAEVRADIDSVKSSTGGGPIPPGSHAEPLPSSRSISPVTPAPHSALTPSHEKTRPSQAVPPDAHEVAASARGLGTTMLILGLLAIAITGGLAFYMANRKPLETHTRSENVNNREIHNTYHNRIIAPGTASAADMEAIEDLKPFQNGFLGITKDALTWNDAQALAERCGAEIPSVDETDPFWLTLLDELKRAFPNHADTALWVRQSREARILKGASLSTPEANPQSETRHRALLHWLTKEPEKTAPSVPQTEPAPPVHASDDWINLFDGLDVSKWKGSKDAGFPDGAWGIEGGALRNFHGANDQGLQTRETFRDFELEFEWKFSPGGNSGIFYGTREFQLVDDVGNSNGKIPVTSCGALCYFIPPNANKRLEPAGKYNRGKLVVRGNQVEHWINGEKIVEYEQGGPALKSLVESGRFKTLPGYKKIDTTAGPTTIGLQSHGGNVWFRNIRIRRLDGPRPDTGEFGNPSPTDSIPDSASSLSPPASSGPLPWTNTDGKAIQAEFIRVEGESVVIRKDGKEFKILLAMLSPTSRAQALELGGGGASEKPPP